MKDESPQTSPERPRRALDVTIQRPKTEQPTSILPTLQLVSTLLKTLAWPTVALVVFYYLREPLREIAKRIPEVLAQSSKLSLGSFTVELREQAKAIGAPQFADLIQGLSPDAVEALLNIGKSSRRLMGEDESMFFAPSIKAMTALIELETKGLLQWDIPRRDFDALIENIPHGKSNNADCATCPDYTDGKPQSTPKRPLTAQERQTLESQAYRLTEKGLKAFDLVIASVANELKAPAVSEKDRQKR